MASSTLAHDGGPAFFLATGVAAAANFVFHVIMSRQLGPATYGALGSLLGLTTSVTLGLASLQAAVTQAVAEVGHERAVRPTAALRRSWRRALALAGLSLVAISAAGPILERFLHLHSLTPVVLFAVFVAATVAGVVPGGVLVGRMRFDVVAWSLVLGAATRLVLGPVLVAGGLGLNGAVTAATANALVSMAVVVWPLRHELRHPSGLPIRFALRSSSLAVVAVGGMSLFIGIDTFLARHFLTAAASGYYVAAATAGRIALFLPSAIGTLAFPRLVAAGGRGPAARTVLVHALVVVAVLGAAASAILIALPGPLIDILYGHRYAPAASALRVLSVAAAAAGLATVAVYGLLARRSAWAALPWLAIGAVAAAIALHHGSPLAVAWVIVLCSAGLVVTALAVLAVSASGDGAVGRPGLHTGNKARPVTESETT